LENWGQAKEMGKGNEKVFYGTSAYRYRGPSFLGVVGLHDAVYLTLEKGLNMAWGTY
jgi:hypothetical protein